MTKNWAVFEICNCNVNHFHSSAPKYSLPTCFCHMQKHIEEKNRSFSIYSKHNQLENDTVLEHEKVKLLLHSVIILYNFKQNNQLCVCEREREINNKYETIFMQL